MTCATNQLNEAVVDIKFQLEKTQLLWKKVIFFTFVHIGALYGLYLMFFVYPSLKYITYHILMLYVGSFGTTVGAHRLWAHRAYKAKLPLRIMLAIQQTLTFQLGIYDWVRDHRIHHKYSDTEFDPHNSKRGFFWCHMGWLFYKKSPGVIQKGKELDLSDLEADPVVMIQKKYYWYLSPLAFVIPAAIPWYFWGVPFWRGFYMFSLSRFCIGLHATCLVNSAAHLWGTKPYDKNICPTQNPFVAHVTFGEGFHNYHHAFPWDYKAAELGSYYENVNTAFIDFMAKIGQAYDLKYASPDMVAKRAKRTGDGSRKNTDVWGWGDKDMSEEDAKMAKISSRLPEEDR